MIGWRRKSDVENSRRRVQEAEARAAASKVEADRIKMIAAQSRNATARLRSEVEKNHFTEMLLQAWGAR